MHATTVTDDSLVPLRGPWRGIRLEVDVVVVVFLVVVVVVVCLLYTSPSPRDVEESRMPSSA